jgi:hypothetical protein
MIHPATACSRKMVVLFAPAHVAEILALQPGADAEMRRKTNRPHREQRQREVRA